MTGHERLSTMKLRAVRRLKVSWQRVGLVLLALATLSAAPDDALACSCAGAWERADADVVFQGAAVYVHEPLHLQFAPRRLEGVLGEAWLLWHGVANYFDSDVQTVFQVNTAWKGTPERFVTLNTGSGLCCNCTLGRVFDPGQQYVVYAVEYEGEMSVSWCGGAVVPGTALSASEELMLGAGAPPRAGKMALPMVWRHMLLPGVALLAVLLPTLLWIAVSKGRAAYRARCSPDAADVSSSSGAGPG